MNKVNCLEQKGEAVKIIGFTEIVNEYVYIQVHKNGKVSFRRRTGETMEQCIKFDGDTLNKPVVHEFLHRHGLLGCQFAFITGSLLPATYCSEK